jgi:heme-degrading monooxygenase HmoA
MITRLWHGYTKPADADKYQRFLLINFLPSLHGINGYEGGYVLRKEDQHEVEFIVLTFWETIDAIKKFAGPELQTPVIAREAERWLSRSDQQAIHYNSFKSE